MTDNNTAVVKVYHGYGDEDGLMVLGHVFKRSPFAPKTYKKGFWPNAIKLLRYFMASTYEGVEVTLQWGNEVIRTHTDEEGLFRLEWKSGKPLRHGWTEVTVQAHFKDGNVIDGSGKILVPYTGQYAFISDIDDTFLVSHSSNLPKRLYQLLTKNPQTRKPFANVARHYQLLANGGDKVSDVPNPFFYVSSSEWNLYEYIKEFCRFHRLPEGVFILNELKQWHQFIKTGQGKHSTKEGRISHIINAFPHRKYVLLGDETQKDPEIYAAIAQQYPQNILCIYIRQVEKTHTRQTEALLHTIREQVIDVLYYKHSVDAIDHSKSMGLIEK